MKNKIYLLLFVVISFVTIIIFSKKNNVLEDMLTFSLVNIESLADEEIDGGDDDLKCTTDCSYEYLWQDCTVYNDTFESIGRITIKHSCKGLGIEVCRTGCLYLYYDCDGYELSSEDMTDTSYCFL